MEVLVESVPLYPDPPAAAASANSTRSSSGSRTAGTGRPPRGGALFKSHERSERGFKLASVPARTVAPDPETGPRATRGRPQWKLDVIQRASPTMVPVSPAGEIC